MTHYIDNTDSNTYINVNNVNYHRLSHLKLIILLCLLFSSVILLNACGGGGSSSPTPSVNQPLPTTHYANIGEQVLLSASITTSDVSGYEWTLSKPAESKLSITDNRRSTFSFVPDVAGTYVATVETLTAYGIVKTSTNVIVSYLKAKDNSFVPACSGAFCGANNSNTYAGGSSIGIWNYNNTNNTPISLDIDISGVNAGKNITLSFSNGSEQSSASLPVNGIHNALELIKNNKVNTVINQSKQEDVAHQDILKRNKTFAFHTINTLENQTKVKAFERLKETTASKAPQFRTLLSPAIGLNRVWIDTFSTTPINYTTVNKAVCTLPNQRNLVFWQDKQDTYLTPSILTQFTNAACGSTGIFARLNQLLGDAWGPHNSTLLISETDTQKQDINIVFLTPPINSDWIGYFGNNNNYKNSAITHLGHTSNEALVFFINTHFIKDNPKFVISTLAHEATHMVNFYQNEILRAKNWIPDWLLEMQAMMSEDIIMPSVTGFNKMSEYRIPNYLATGGATSLTYSNDTFDYDMAGTFATFLNRQYGLNIYQQLITGCNSPTELNNEYACLNQLIINNGGQGIANEFSKLGASIYAQLPSTNIPLGYGFPIKTDGAYTLQAIDTSTIALTAPISLLRYYPMTHTYFNEVMPIGKTRYIRRNVIIPANSSLRVVIR